MRKVKTVAGAQRAFEWFASIAPANGSMELTFRIHRGGGQCVCSACEDARKKLDQIMRASK